MRLSGIFHSIKRSDIFDSVNQLISNEAVRAEYPSRVMFPGEAAFDSGGVCRDMFSAYWEVSYKKFFDGNCVLTTLVWT